MKANLGGACLLLALLLCCGRTEAETESDASPKIAAALRREKDDLLNKKLAVVAAAQRNGTDTTGVVVESDWIEQAAPVRLWAGYGDVSTTGECMNELRRHCEEVEPGEGRLADCLMKRLQEEGEGNARGRKVSGACHTELAAFVLDRATSINKDVPLAKACRADVEEHCTKGGHAFEDGSEVLDCLRDHRKKLSEQCGRRVFAEALLEAKDFRLDVRLFKACHQDAVDLCSDEDPDEEGEVMECLVEHRAQASSFCQEQLQRVEVQRGDDVRLNPHTHRACSADIKRYCQGVAYGDARVRRCLEDAREEDDFSARCRQALEGGMEREAADYQLNYGLREYCEEDIKQLCREEREQIALSEAYSADSQVITCLETQHEHIRSKRCRNEVKRQLQRESEDIRFDHALAEACFKDVKRHCPAVVPGSARVITCLQEHREQLSDACSAKLFEHEVKVAEDIDFRFPLRRGCMVEIDLLCKGVPHGSGRIIRCLQAHMDSDDMSSECRAEVKKDENYASKDFRLNYRLRKACLPDAQRLCGALVESCKHKQCSGRVLNCLRDGLEDIRGEECRQEVLNFVGLEVADFRNDVSLAAACQLDVDSYCADVGDDPSDGAVHDCLRKHMQQLSEECRREELRLDILQARDIRLRPHLLKTCSEEVAVFCKDVEPGKGRMFRCLAQSMSKSGFSEACRQEVSLRVELAQGDFRLDYGTATSCKADARAVCGQEEAAAEGHALGQGLVLACLVRKYEQLADGCQSELSRAVRMALWGYRQGGQLTKVCDGDVQAICPALGQQRGMLTIGSVGRCLSKQVAEGGELSPGCRQLVVVAAPRDARSIFDSSMSLEAVAAKVAQIAHSAGLSSTFVDPKAEGMGAITLTGLVAFLSMLALAAVLLGALGLGVRRYFLGPHRNYTSLTTTPYKRGDV